MSNVGGYTNAADGRWDGVARVALLAAAPPYGKVAATAIDMAIGRAVRVWPHPEAPDRWHAQLVGYRAMPADELLLSRTVRLAGSLDALLGQPGQRVSCARCGEEILNGREVIVSEGATCAGCAGASYYRDATSDESGGRDDRA